eukprot:9494909-Pyramimonas_sp.AAC.2
MLSAPPGSMRQPRALQPGLWPRSRTPNSTPQRRPRLAQPPFHLKPQKHLWVVVEPLGKSGGSRKTWNN